mgnify:CR=1 FL=1
MKKFLAILFLAGFSLPVVVIGAPPTTSVPNLPQEGDLTNAVNNILRIVYWILWTMAIIAFFWAGILFVTAAGDASKIAQARTTAFYAVIGLIVAMLAFTIRSFLQNQLGV